ncbi:MAG: hypothetical protein HY294_06645 [Candidatus Rokubacteria bacterium]|nr:hypothetical protein [Candidatus Rokubacteria bacterium]
MTTRPTLSSRGKGNAQIGDWVGKVWRGDARELLRELPVESVDLVITDPPYFISRNTVIHRAMRPMKYRAARSITLDFGTWDHFVSEADYWRFTRDWLTAVARVIRPGGHLVTFFDQNRVSYLIALAKREGLACRQHLYWVKSNPAPRARKVDFMIALEHAIWFTKEPRSGATFNYQLGQQKNYVLAAVPHHPRLHPTQKPEAVLRVWIAYLSGEGDVVLDPFAGSGSTLCAARDLSRQWVACEREAEYVAVARTRLAQRPCAKPTDRALRSTPSTHGRNSR